MKAQTRVCARGDGVVTRSTAERGGKVRRCWTALLAAVTMAALAMGAAPPVQDAAGKDEPKPYIRVKTEEGGRVVRLQTVARKFVKNQAEGEKAQEGPTLHLVAAVHIGDRDFYKTLQASLDAKDVVLFEGVRPPGTGRLGADAQLSGDARAEMTRDRLRILAAAVLHVRQRDGAYPESLEALPGKLGDRAGPFVRDLLADGWGRAIEYSLATRHSRPHEPVTFDLQSRGADGAIGGQGLDADIAWSGLDRTQDAMFDAWLAATDGEEDDKADAGIQQKLARALGLRFQLDEMDHSGPNWRSSDLSMDQLQARLRESGADGSALFGALSGTSLTANIAGLLLGIIGSNEALATIVKVAMLDMLAQADKILEAQPGEMGKLMDVILHDRNEVVLNDLRAVLRDEPDVKSVAVIYGGGHMAGLERGVREMGFTPVEDVWLDAISVDTSKTGMSVAEVNAMRAQLKRTMEMAIKAQQPKTKRKRRTEPE